MKIIYFALLTSLCLENFSQTNLTLTQALQEPIVGDNRSSQDYDSVGVIPKSTGTNQNWNFASIVKNTRAPFTTTFVPISSVPTASLFTGATIAEKYGVADFSIYKITGTPNTQLEYLGSAYAGTANAGYNYTNSVLSAVWPFAPNNTFTDTFSGSSFNQSTTYTEIGSLTVTSAGSGTITMPDGSVYTDIVQIIMKQKTLSTSSSSSSIITHTNTYTNYAYYHCSQKFPLLQVNYAVSVGTVGSVGTSSYSSISVNKLISLGIQEENFDRSLSIFPNPANGKINFQLDNLKAEKCALEIQNLMGQQIKLIEFGNQSSIQETIYIDDLEKGIYFLKTSLGEKVHTQKLLVE